MVREHKLEQATHEQAAQAWERFHGGEAVSASGHGDFAAWMMRSPEHIEAYLRVSRTMQALRPTRVRWPDIPAEVLVREARAQAGEVVVLRSASPSRARTPARKISFRIGLAMAASLLVAIAAGWFAWIQPQTFETGFGEQRLVRLEDGSGVMLNTSSRIEVRLRRGHRDIRLLRGEALFEVAHDAARPFDVHAGSTVARAVGTRFSVDRRATHTVVTVLEGIVAVTQGADQSLPQGNSPLLRAGDRVVIDGASIGSPQHGINIDEATAWTRQQLVFKHRPLGEVAEEFNRYNRKRLIIGTAALRSQEISGVFGINDTASFEAFLAGTPGVRIRDDGNDGRIVTLVQVTQP